MSAAATLVAPPARAVRLPSFISWILARPAVADASPRATETAPSHLVYLVGELTRVVAPPSTFGPQPLRAASRRASRASRVAFVPRAAASAPCALTECELDTRVVRAATVNGKTVDASALRAVSVMSPAGDLVNLGEAMGPGKAILVMLRHLG